MALLPDRLAEPLEGVLDMAFTLMALPSGSLSFAMTGIVTETPTVVLAESGLAIGGAAKTAADIAESPIPATAVANSLIPARMTTLLRACLSAGLSTDYTTSAVYCRLLCGQ
jgi:hypothetical protein